eukprot:TRINITY_DN1469_c0_g1_i1.p1 TRINITY_DN1469_c0_g1~~TRINITY_DN1469_c0_g1_i1.p1  ORF type:complete len:1749 (-),score=247.95 TRINITY_DN1469_c0_g1_i1:989-6235(-)
MGEVDPENDSPGEGSAASRPPSPRKNLHQTEFAELSLFNWTKKHRFRAACIRMVQSSWFDVVALLVVVIDMVVMAVNSPILTPDSPLPTALKYVDLACIALFTIELGIRVVAQGAFMQKHSYWRDRWNVFDTLMVIVSWPTYFVLPAPSTYVRALRALRPLRSMKLVPGLQHVVNSLLKTLPTLGPLFAVTLLFLLVYGIMGLYFFAGVLENFCIDSMGNYDPAYFPCAMDETGPRLCPTNFTCQPGVAMLTNSFSITSFDNIFYSVQQVFTIFTMENWGSNVMTLIWAATSSWAPLFFCTALVLSQYIFLNLLLASVAGTFADHLDVFEDPTITDAEKLEMQHVAQILRNRDQKKTSRSTVQSTNSHSTFNSRDSSNTDSFTARGKTPPPLPLPPPQLPAMPSFRHSPAATRITAERRSSAPNIEIHQPDVVEYRRTVSSVVSPSSVGVAAIASPDHRNPMRASITSETALTPADPIRDTPPLMIPTLSLTQASRQDTLPPIGRPSQSGGARPPLDLPPLPRLAGNFTENLSRTASDVTTTGADELPGMPRDSSMDMLARENSWDEMNQALALQSFMSVRSQPQDRRFLTTPDAQFLVPLRTPASALPQISGEPDSPKMAPWIKDRLGMPPAPDCFPATRSSIAAGSKWGQSVLMLQWQRVRAWCYRLVNYPAFEYFLMTVIMANTIVLSLHHYGEPETLTSFSYVMNIFFTVFFVLELVLHIVGTGCYEYFTNGLNFVDAAVTVASIVQLSVGDGGAALALRCLRALRMLRLLKVWTATQQILPTIAAAIRQSLFFLLLLALVQFVIAIIGMNMFAGRLDPFASQGSSMISFDNWWFAFIGAWQLMSISNWPNVAYDLVVSMDGNPWYSLFPILSIILTNYVMLNLMIGILLDKFDAMSEQHRREQLSKFIRGHLETQLYSSKTEPHYDPAVKHMVDQYYARKQKSAANPADSHHSLFVFGPEHPLRLRCQKIIRHRLFVGCVLVVIVANGIFLALSSPVTPGLQPMLVTANYVFMAIFAAEFLLRVIADGFVMHRGAYLRDPWNILDLFALVFAIIDASTPSSINVSWLRATRCLRPLRIVSNLRSMRIAAYSLLRSLHHMVALLIVLLVIWLVYAVVGVNLWAGTFYQCSDNSNATMVDCMSTVVNGRNLTWNPTYYPNFDNLGMALLSLFQVGTMQSWEFLMYAAMDATSPGYAPVFRNSPGVGLYFLTFLVVGTMFGLSMFVGITVENYQAQRSIQDRTVLMTTVQREWFLVSDAVLRERPVFLHRKPTNAVRAAVWIMCEHRFYTYAKTLIACLNVITLCVNVAHPPRWMMEFQLYSTYTFAAIFALEVLLEVIAVGPRIYVSDPWNIFDSLIAATAIADIFVTDPVATNVFATFRALRVLQIARQFDRTMLYLKTVWIALPSLLNVGMLLSLVFYIFAILAVQFFGSVKLQGDLNEMANFSTFPMALLTLFRISTMDGWNDVMNSCRVDFPDCTPGVDCGSPVAPLFFIIFLMMVGFILVNLFIAVIISSLENLRAVSRGITNDHAVNKFKFHWSHFDPDRTGYIRYEDFTALRRRLPAPLGIPAWVSDNQASKLLLHLNVPLTIDRRVQFNRVLFELTRHIVGVPLPPAAYRKRKKMLKKITDGVPSLGLTVRQLAAAASIVRFWRANALRRVVNRSRSNSAHSAQQPPRVSPPERIVFGVNLLAPYARPKPPPFAPTAMLQTFMSVSTAPSEPSFASDEGEDDGRVTPTLRRTMSDAE